MSREMKDSGVEWIGKIPESWDIQRGKFIFTKLSRPVQDNDEVITCFRDGEVTLRRNRREEGFTFSDKEIGYQGIEPEDLVVHGMDGFAGSIGISDSRGKATPVLNVLDTKYSKPYYMYYLRSMAYSEVFTSIATGIRVRSCNLNWNKLGELSYPVPSANEQKDIANYIKTKCTAIDTAIEKTKKSIEKLEEYKKAVITKVVTKGIDPNAKMKDSGVEWIGEIPEDWEVKQLRTYFSRRINKNIHLQEKNLLSLSYGRIVRKNIDTKEGLLPESFDGYNIIEDGDIVIRGTDLQNDHRSLRTGLVTERGIITSAYMTLSPQKDVNSTYYHYLLHCYDISKVFYSMGGGLRQSLDYWEFIRMPVLHPTDREQEEIVSYIKTKCTAIDNAIEKKKKAIEKWEEYKKSLIYYAVTGKIECRNEVIE